MKEQSPTSSSLRNILSTAVLSALLSACETTGDPHQGGYLGWSENKAVVRQNNMRTELVGLNQTGAELTSERSRLEGELSSLNSQLQRAKARQEQATIARLEAEIRSKEARLATLTEVL